MNNNGAVALGRQMTVEFYECSAAILADVRKMEEVFLHAADVSGAHVVNSNFHSFEPQGVSGVIVISESHFAVHAWPEHDYAAVDIFTCGGSVDFSIAVNALASGMKSRQWVISSMVHRGILQESGELERLVPIVENPDSCGLQLSWKDRFEASSACAMSAAVDIYNCRTADFGDEKKWQIFAGEIAKMAGIMSDGGGKWLFSDEFGEGEFQYQFKKGRICVFFSSAEKNIYLDIFARGFFDPRKIAEFAMADSGGTYYRMQPQIRQ